MFSSEIKETVYISIGLILAAIVLGLIAFVMDIRSDFAEAQNSEVVARQEMSNYSRFDKYQGEVIYGEDIIGIIREFAGTDVAVCVDNLRLKSTGASATNYFYMNKEKYMANPNNYSLATLELGNNAISRDATYVCWLVFGKYTENEIKNSKYVEEGFRNADGTYAYVNYADVSGIYVRCINKTQRLHYQDVKTTVDNLLKP